MSQQEQAQSQSVDPMGEVVEKLVMAAFVIAMACVCAPLVIPVLGARITGTVLATKTWFWITWRWQWIVNTIGVAILAGLVVAEAVWIAQWVSTGQSSMFFATADWKSQVLHLWPWLVVNFLAGILLLPVTWSIRRRQVATLVRNRRIADVVQQTRIETARKRAADRTAARRIGVSVDPRTGQITGSSRSAMTAPLLTPDGAQAFGLVNRATVRTMADRFYDARRVRDWIDPSGTYAQLPVRSSAVRFLLIAESGTGKTVFLNSAMQCALTYGWPVFFIDAKGDPEDADALAELAGTFGRTAAINAGWNMFSGTSEQVTAKLMRLMPPADGANQHYLDEIRGILQAVQDASPLRSVEDLRERLTNPVPYVRDQYDLDMVNAIVDSRAKISAGERTLQSLLVALRPLERWLDADGWSYDNPRADITIVPLSPADDTQARLGDLLLLDLRNFLTNRLMRRDKSPVLVVVDEFPQLVTGTSDPGDTAGSLYETARSAGVGLGLAAQSPAGLSNDDTRRRRALASGAALIFGRQKDPEDVVKYAGTYMQMESSGAATGEELKSARAQHTYVIPPQDVREASDAQFWIIQGGSMASFRALPNRRVDMAKKAGSTDATS
ncbi:hypothetical protein HII28_19635 [Planctomonas sp. JC2975]|uniref:hypothetical protein n=1 Tax=Planctomonas sp. JC2975 TaxID=2729626 RepID=UPI0014763461|nr:hypothetical protein [Planctomonas sp. JC2975]NNC14076.1 hypothetical protein [Planctomonas sp. JC2975]